MTITYARAASTLLLAATAMSAGYQLYRATVATHPEVDRFGLDAGIGYAVLTAVAVALSSDRRVAWWAAGLLTTGLLAYGVVGYYPMIHAARPMGLLDWLEGTLFTGTLLLVIALAALRLSGVALVPAPAPAGRPRTGTATVTR